MTHRHFIILLCTVICGAAVFAPVRPASGAIASCCCFYKDFSNTGQCESAALEAGQSCADVKGADWVTVDDEKWCAGKTGEAPDTKVEFTPQVTIPNSSFEAGVTQDVGILAAVMIMWGGYKWMTASGNTGRVQDAKNVIYSALIAMLITFGAYLLVPSDNYTIDFSFDNSEAGVNLDGATLTIAADRTVNGIAAGGNLVTVPPVFLDKFIDHRYSRETVRGFNEDAARSLVKMDELRAVAVRARRAAS